MTVGLQAGNDKSARQWIRIVSGFEGRFKKNRNAFHRIGQFNVTFFRLSAIQEIFQDDCASVQISGTIDRRSVNRSIVWKWPQRLFGPIVNEDK